MGTVSTLLTRIHTDTEYDVFGRADVTAITPGTGASTYYSKQTYDGCGRPYQHVDAARSNVTGEKPGAGPLPTWEAVRRFRAS